MVVVIAAVVVLAVLICSFWLGAYVITLGRSRRVESPVPVARLQNLEGRDAVYAKMHRGGRVVLPVLRRVTFTSLGLGIIAAPWIVIYQFFSGLGDMSFGSKGRVLRVRSRAQLAELATGDGWSDDPITLQQPLVGRARDAIGELWLLTARMEHASVAAFSQLSLHLAALGAPSRLVERTHRAALEEIRHARRCFAIVRAITGVEHTAGPIVALQTSRPAPIDRARLALGSLIDGCLAEGIAADVAARGAATADEPAIRNALTMIAHDEAGHAELAWDVLAWALAHGDGDLHEAVAARVEVLTRELSPRLPDLPDLDAAVQRAYGIIDQDALGLLAEARVVAVRDRARGLLSAAQPAPATARRQAA